MHLYVVHPYAQKVLSMVKYSATNLSLRNTRLSESEKLSLYGQIYKQVLIDKVTRNLLLWFMSMKSLAMVRE